MEEKRTTKIMNTRAKMEISDTDDKPRRKERLQGAENNQNVLPGKPNLFEMEYHMRLKDLWMFYEKKEMEHKQRHLLRLKQLISQRKLQHRQRESVFKWKYQRLQQKLERFRVEMPLGTPAWLLSQIEEETHLKLLQLQERAAQLERHDERMYELKRKQLQDKHNFHSKQQADLFQEQAKILHEELDTWSSAATESTSALRTD